jgi:hypothetical protein
MQIARPFSHNSSARHRLKASDFKAACMHLLQRLKIASRALGRAAAGRN